jgi:23S rRNA pseudouridine2605 synthase
MHKNGKSGVARALSKMGCCSRSRAIALVRAGRVTLNGRLVRDPETPVRMGQDHIGVNGLGVEERPKIYLMMNKPRGVVTTASDEKGRATVYGLLDSCKNGEWISPVGRLDKASEGMLLLTNDSKWAAKITDPASHLDKRYHVQVDRVAGDDLLERLRHGVSVGGDLLRVKDARVLRVGSKNSWLEMTLDEGKNRQIRRLLEALGVQVLRLVRVSIGLLELGDLKKGAVRPLTKREKLLVDQALDGKRG